MNEKENWEKIEKCRLKVPREADREKIISGLANSGYQVWVEIEKHQFWEGGDVFYVVFNIK